MYKMSWKVAALLVALGMQAVSCKKSVDTPAEELTIESTANAIAVDDFSTCKLRRIQETFWGEPFTAVFTYTTGGKPYSVVYDHTADGVYNHYFTYDAQGRLKQLFRTFGDIYYDILHVYQYNSSNRIILEETYSGNGTNNADYSRTTFTYDSLGRIVKESILLYKSGKAPAVATTKGYLYDNRGNLAVKGWASSRYDYTKVSLFRTHPIFQFIHRNYSRNNASIQPKYNSRGLPLTMVPGNDLFFSAATGSGNPNFVGTNDVRKLIYDCQ